MRLRGLGRAFFFLKLGDRRNATAFGENDHGVSRIPQVLEY